MLTTIIYKFDVGEFREHLNLVTLAQLYSVPRKKHSQCFKMHDKADNRLWPSPTIPLFTE